MERSRLRSHVDMGVFSAQNGRGTLPMIGSAVCLFLCFNS